MPSPSISAEQFRQILDVTRMLAVTTELKPLLDHIARAATSLLNCERASIFLHDAKTDELTTTIALESDEIRVPSAAGIVGHVFQSNKIAHVARPYEDARFNRDADRRSGFVTRNLLSAPMVDLNRKPIGVIQAVNNHSPDGFSSVHEAVIQLLADQAGVAIQRFRLQRDAIEGANLRREMDLASRVQQAMVPSKWPRVAGLDCIGWTKPASITGGDTFDLWETRDHQLGIFLADASGHGLGPALIVSQARSLVRALSDEKLNAREILDRINARLNQDLQGGSFVTAFLGIMNSNGELDWCAAGQGPLLIRKNRHAEFQIVEPTAPPLGILPDFTSEPVLPLQLQPGGMLAVLSDGVFEARRADHTMFDASRVIASLQAARAQTIETQLAQLRAQISAWQGGDEPTDDQTILLVLRN